MAERVKQKSGWVRAKDRGHLPVMVVIPKADRPLIEAAARAAGLKVSTYIKTVALAQAYCDCGCGTQGIEQ